MKNLTIFLITVIGIVNSSTAQDQTVKAEEFFKNSTIITFNENIKPIDLIGSLIYYKKDQKENFEYIPLFDEKEKRDIEPNFNNEVIYQSMINKETVAKVKYLAVFSTNVKVNNLMEVILEDVYDLSISTFITNVDIKSKVFYWATFLKKSGYIVEYVDKVNLSTVTTRLYKENNSNVKAGFGFVDAEGKYFAKESDFNLKKLVSVHSINITDFIVDSSVPLKNNKFFDEKQLKTALEKKSDGIDYKVLEKISPSQF